MTYHYIESGLDNVYLENGYHSLETPYGNAVSIDSSDDLHKAIGSWLVQRPTPLNGAELRFLRTEMDATQRSLAGIIGASEQSLRLWEKHRSRDIPSMADRILRALYSNFLGDKTDIRSLLERVADLDRQAQADACFQRKSNAWKPLAAPPLEARV